MDFIYSRLNNNLVDINKVKSLTLFECTQDNVPIDGIKAGYFYLELDVVDSDRTVYCDLSDFIDNRLPIPDQTDIAKVLTVGEDGKYQLSDIATPTDVYTKEEADEKFQDKLQSGTNIKTINNENILGEGNINISGGTTLNKYTYSFGTGTVSTRVLNIINNSVSFKIYKTTAQGRLYYKVGYAQSNYWSFESIISDNAGNTADIYVYFSSPLTTKGTHIYMNAGAISSQTALTTAESLTIEYWNDTEITQ